MIHESLVRFFDRLEPCRRQAEEGACSQAMDIMALRRQSPARRHELRALRATARKADVPFPKAATGRSPMGTYPKPRLQGDELRFQSRRRLQRVEQIALLDRPARFLKTGKGRTRAREEPSSLRTAVRSALARRTASLARIVEARPPGRRRGSRRRKRLRFRERGFGLPEESGGRRAWHLAGAAGVGTPPTVWPSDATGIERIGRYLLRCPVSLERIHWTPGAKSLFYQGKASHDDPFASDPQGETLDIFEFLARVLSQILEPRRHGPHYFGAYASRARVLRNKQALEITASPTPASETDEPLPDSKRRAALRKRWASLIKRVFKADPLLCECGGKFQIISFITEPKEIARILEHLDKRNTASRDPPQDSHRAPSAAP